MKITAVLFLIPSLGLCLAHNAPAQDGAYQGKVGSLRQEYNAYAHSNALQAGKQEAVNQEIGSLESKAGRIDQLSSQVDSDKSKIDGLEADFQNADSRASALEQQLQTDGESAKARVNQLMQQANQMCGQLGGSISGDNCVFTCPSNNMAPCQAKVNQFNAQAGNLLSEVKSLVQNLTDESNTAASARDTANAKKSDLENAQSALSTDKSDFNDLSSGFDADFQKAANDLEAAHIKPSLEHSEAWQQLNNVSEHQGKTPVSDYDSFNGNVVIVDKTIPPPNPQAVAKSPQYKAVYDQKASQYQQAVQETERAQKAFQEAAAQGAGRETLSALYKTLMEKKSAEVYAQYESNLLAGSRPKPAGATPTPAP